MKKEVKSATKKEEGKFKRVMKEEIALAKDKLLTLISAGTSFARNKSYTLVITQKGRQMLRSGNWNIARDGNVLFAFLKDKDTGKIMEQIRFRKSGLDIARSINTLAMAGQLQIITEKLNTLIELVEDVEAKLDEIRQGQTDDRISYVETGIDMVYKGWKVKNYQTRVDYFRKATENLVKGQKKLEREEKSLLNRIEGLVEKLTKKKPGIRKFKKWQNELEKKLLLLQEVRLNIAKSIGFLWLIHIALNENDLADELMDECRKYFKTRADISEALEWIKAAREKFKGFYSFDEQKFLKELNELRELRFKSVTLALNSKTDLEIEYQEENH
ncbi:MAG: hypothetical protein E3J71_03950 [Candidatus Stahlbacteria bacterium]|nr:MAG: hypothetical protein E3J71_03950 [Candidatus Stahlbacteria bacterium]